MKMQSLKCPNCGGSLDIEDGFDTFFCKYCGHKIIMDDISKDTLKAKVRMKEMQHEEAMSKNKHSFEMDKSNNVIKHKIKLYKVYFVIGAAIAIAFIALLGSLKISSDNQEKELQQIVNNIEADMKNGDYDSALIKANSLYYTVDWSNDVQNKWDSTRKELIKMIKDKQDK